ncbi:hypothetical protein G7L40_02950 [Paenibacillus polymyxa]|uniref:Tail tape measure protein n=1 Tax=Paenibacillus polymyxa TaxID=1406 RepID=A0A378XU24_PAEPO|nr:hypothetical protein [Paenibacillus polymyxa]MBE7897838.1 hypothetical protein [Paenibacillus polymyxa]MBG9764369.1 hypothetical protein [Paenibacillus polymyxa]MCC3259470.1 hypothetical protein [Paenibacillus polymyxa]QPK51780.1 hypothetical protein G7035_02945 [Paenibacillus polymyxa]QPK56866.1 hypothetical protein G7L40_02950 [Paenibacillus polymyxa]
MAEALNYRMNLVIDPKNVIKANRELRAMERYFERIQGRVLKIGRTRMAPEIVLNDMASKGLDNLLNKINRVKSQIINASGNVNVKVNSGTAKADPVKSDNNLSTVLKANTTAVEANTKAIADLSTKLGSLKIGGEAKEEEPKGFLENLKDTLGGVKKIGEGMKGFSELKEKRGAFRAEWDKVKSVGGATRRQKLANGARKIWENRAALGKAGGEVLESFGGTGDMLEGVMDFFKGGGGMIGNIKSGGSAAIDAVSSAASSIINPSTAGAVEEAGSGLFKNLLKGGAKKLLGPLSYGMDIMNIAQSAPGKERSQAIGSAIGGGVLGTVGGIVGSVIPGAGTVIGSTLGSMAGDWIGGKIGGLVSDYGPAMMEKAKSAGKLLGEKASQVKGWLSDKAGDFGKSFSVFFSFGKKDEPKKEPTKPPEVHKPSIPPNSNIGASLKPLATMPPLYSASAFVPPQPGAKGVSNPYGPMAIANQGVNPSPMLNTAAHANNGAKAKGKANGNPTPQVVQISPEQMGTLSGFLKDFKTETTNQFNLPAGAVQVTVHENKLDVDGLITQIGYRLKAEILRATQNTKPTGAGAM